MHFPECLHIHMKNHVDIAARGAGIGADFVRLGDERVGGGLVHAGQGDVEDHAQAEVVLLILADADVGIDGQTLRQRNFFVASDQAHRARRPGR